MKHCILLIVAVCFSLAGMAQNRQWQKVEQALTENRWDDAQQHYSRFVHYLVKKQQYEDDSLGALCFSIAQRVDTAAGSTWSKKWYERSVAYYMNVRAGESPLGSGRIYREMALSLLHLNDTLSAREAAVYSYYHTPTDTQTLNLLGQLLYHEGEFTHAKRMFGQLASITGTPVPYLEKSTLAEQEAARKNQAVNAHFTYDEHTLIYGQDGLGVFAHNLQTDQRVRLYTFDSLTALFQHDMLQLIDDSTLSIALRGNDYDIDDENGFRETAHYFTEYVAVNLRTLQSWRYKQVETINHNSVIIRRDTNIQVFTRFYAPDGSPVAQTDSAFKGNSTRYSFRGPLFSLDTSSIYIPYFCFRQETRQVNGMHLVSDTGGLYIHHDTLAQPFHFLPYKLTFRGHVPVGYINPDLSPDGKNILYVYKPGTPWEERFFRDNQRRGINQACLMTFDLENRSYRQWTDYDVKNPLFSHTAQYIACFAINPFNFNAEMLEVIDTRQNRTIRLGEADAYVWYTK